jgi:hypothetical protein
VTVLLGPLVGNDLLHPASYVAVDGLSLRSEQIAATNVPPQAVLTQTPLTIDAANLLALRGQNAYRLRNALTPVLEASEYADRLQTLIASERELRTQVGTTSGSA